MPPRDKKSPTESQIEDSQRLKRLFDVRASMSQLAFGQNYDIGNQAMVWQYLHADTPKGSVLNVPAAIKFATGLRCSVADFSPSLQNEIDHIAKFASTAPLMTAEQRAPYVVEKTTIVAFTPEEQQVLEGFRVASEGDREQMLWLADRAMRVFEQRNESNS